MFHHSTTPLPPFEYRPSGTGQIIIRKTERSSAAANNKTLFNSEWKRRMAGKLMRTGLNVSIWPILAVWILALLPARSANKAAPGATIDFNREIRPILSENCFKCHGPDEKERKAKLRFDRKEDALKPAKSGDFAIVPGEPAKSKMVERITSKDPDEQMPPPKSGKKLTASKIE